MSSNHEIIICDICRKSLLLKNKDRDLTLCTKCCTVSHPKCRNKNDTCRSCKKEGLVYTATFDVKENSDYLKMEKENRKLAEENENLNSDMQMSRQQLSQEIEKLEIEKRQVSQEKEELEHEWRQFSQGLENGKRQLSQAKEKLDNDRRQLAQEKEKLINENKEIVNQLEVEKQKLFDGNEYLRKENCELRKRMITAEVKLTKLSNPNLLEERYAQIEWSDLTAAFQEELMGKLRSSYASSLKLDEVLPFNSKAVMRLIKAEEGNEDLLRNIIEDCLSNGKVDWTDLNNSFCTDLLSKLRETSYVSGLELNHVPLSSNVLLHLLKNQIYNDSGFLGELVTTYISGALNGCQKMSAYLLKLVLIELINDNDQILGGLEFPNSDPQVPKTLVKLGVLKKREVEMIAPFEFVHDSVRHWVIGTMIRELLQSTNLYRMNALRLFYDGDMSADPLGVYLSDFICKRQPNFTEVNDGEVAGLLMMFSVLKLPSREEVTSVIKHLKTLHPERSLVDIEYFRKNHELTITLHHAAVIKGSLDLVRCLLNEFGFSKELGNPRFRNLMLACVENTKSATSDQVNQRKEIINELLQLNGNLINCDTPDASLNVHDHLIKFMVGKGSDSWFDLVSPAAMVKDESN